MRINIEGGFVEIQELNGKISVSVGCEHYDSDGVRNNTVINTAALSSSQFKDLVSWFFVDSISTDVVNEE